MVKEKRPPITVEELIKRKEEEREVPVRGALTYVEGQKPLIDERQKRGRFRWNLGSSSVRMVLPILVSVVLAAIMLVQFAPSKGDVRYLLGQVADVRSSLSTLGEKLNYETGRVDNIVGKMGTYASTGNVRELHDAQQAEIVTLRAQLTELRKRLESLEGNYSTLLAK